MSVPTALPKRTSGAFRTERARLFQTLDLPRLCVVLEGALDRGTLEDLIRRAWKGEAPRSGALPRADLVAAVAKEVVRSDEVAWQAMRHLDRASTKERHIVASLPDDDDLQVRLRSYRALDFRRERARLVWALCRDGRDKTRDAAEGLLREAFRSMEEAVADRRRQDAAEPAPAEQDLRQKVQLYESAIHEQASLLNELDTKRSAAEEDRSALLIRIGERERALRAEESRRRALEEALRTTEQVLAQRTDVADALAGLQKKLDEEIANRLRLERQVAHFETQHDVDALSTVRAELKSALAENLALERALAASTTSHGQLEAELDALRIVHDAKLHSLRQELKEARRGPRVEPPPRSAEPRVGIYVDGSNLVASARRSNGARFDFALLRNTVLDGRECVECLCFVIDSGENPEGFASFRRALVAAGFEPRVRKVRVRSDGTRKGDWDLGIALAMLDASDRIDVAILCSGDGDFLPIVQRLKAAGKQVEIASFPDSTDPDLVRAANRHQVLDAAYFLP